MVLQFLLDHQKTKQIAEGVLDGEEDTTDPNTEGGLTEEDNSSELHMGDGESKKVPQHVTLVKQVNKHYCP